MQRKEKWQNRTFWAEIRVMSTSTVIESIFGVVEAFAVIEIAAVTQTVFLGRVLIGVDRFQTEASHRAAFTCYFQPTLNPYHFVFQTLSTILQFCSIYGGMAKVVGSVDSPRLLKCEE